MQRLRVIDCRLSRLPEAVGLCKIDVPGVCDYINSAQRRLLYCKEAGTEGWWGTWAEMAFIMDRSNPYLTTPREVARLEGVTVCDRAIPIRNQFFEYLQFGNGRLPKLRRDLCVPEMQVFSRNNVPTFVDLTNPPQLIVIAPIEDADIGRRVLLQGVDNSGARIWSLDGLDRVEGIFVTLDKPFVVAPMQFNQITGIQKDITLGEVQFFQQDPATAAQIKLLTMEPGETTASYRRYYFSHLPRNCCFGAGTGTTVTVTALAKLDLIPVTTDTDYCLLQNLEAITEEAMAVRYSMVDSTGAKQMAAERHTMAVRNLIGEVGHYLGINDPAVIFKPFGSARLERLKIAMR